MQLLFGKYWKFILLGIIIIIGLAVLIQLTKDTNNIAEWVFEFLSEWAVILATAVTGILVLTALLAIRENRRSQAFLRVRTWAEEVILLLSASGEPQEKNRGIQLLWLKALAMSADARFIGGDLKRKAGDVIVLFQRFHKVVSIKDATLQTAALSDKDIEELFGSLSDLVEMASGIAPIVRTSKKPQKE